MLVVNLLKYELIAQLYPPTNTNNATSVRNKVRDLIKYLMNQLAI